MELVSSSRCCLLSLIVLSVLFASVSILDGRGSSFLGLDFLCFELLPKFFELCLVTLDVVRVIDNEKIFLIVGSSLEGPVEGSCEEEGVIHNHELVVHVILLMIVSSHRDAIISQLLTVIALVLHGLIVSDDLDLDTSVPDLLDGFGKIVVGEVEDADQDGLLCHLYVFDKFPDVVLVREEEGVHVSGLWSVQVKLHLGDVLFKVG